MGLNCSHGAWDGAYSSFMYWRRMIAKVAGLPPLDLMEGFYCPLDCKHSVPTLYHGFHTREPAYGQGSKPYMADIDERLPIKWECLKPSPLLALLNHSDCDGDIPPDQCGPIAEELSRLVPMIHEEYWKAATVKFIAGLCKAAEAGEPLLFR